tara:strand:- start:372 stop:1283 length:912 start_codon:yes stop_codon:yes gene_type:complete
MDKIGVVTITYNSANVLSPFLDCIYKQTYNNFILYVIDNSSSDETISILNEVQDSRFVLIQNNINYGVAKANNQGVKRAIKDDCHQILIINNDVEFEDSLFEKLIKTQNTYNCSLVAPKIMFFDQPDCIWYAGSWFNKRKGYLPLHRGMNAVDNKQFNKNIQVEYAPTCCLLIKKEVFDDVGLMNEKYFVYFDDTDFLFRVLKNRKHKLYYYYDVLFFHKVGSLSKSFNMKKKKLYRGSFFIQQNTRNHVYFLKQIGTIYAYFYIVWLFFKNNFKFFLNKKIKKDLQTWRLINKSYFEGILMK